METLNLARVLKENEMLMAELYSECQKLFPKHTEFFRLLEQEEYAHANILEKIIDNIIKQPEFWKMGNISLKTAEVVNQRLKELISEIKNDKVSPKYAVTSAISIELSMSERNIGKALVTEDKTFVAMLEALADGFDSHYKKLIDIEKTVFKLGQTGI